MSDSESDVSEGAELRAFAAQAAQLAAARKAGQGQASIDREKLTIAAKLVSQCGIDPKEAERGLVAVAEERAENDQEPLEPEAWAEEAQMWVACNREATHEAEKMRDAMSVSLAEAEAEAAANRPEPLARWEPEALQAKFQRSSFHASVREEAWAVGLLEGGAKEAATKLLELESNCVRWYPSNNTVGRFFEDVGARCAAAFQGPDRPSHERIAEVLSAEHARVMGGLAAVPDRAGTLPELFLPFLRAEEDDDDDDVPEEVEDERDARPAARGEAAGDASKHASVHAARGADARANATSTGAGASEPTDVEEGPSRKRARTAESNGGEGEETRPNGRPAHPPQPTQPTQPPQPPQPTHPPKPPQPSQPPANPQPQPPANPQPQPPVPPPVQPSANPQPQPPVRLPVHRPRARRGRPVQRVPAPTPAVEEEVIDLCDSD